MAGSRPLPSDFESLALLTQEKLRILGEDIARKENWGPAPGFRILRSYIRYTYQYLATQEPWKLVSKISNGKSYIVFNTGLYTPLFDPIYIVLEEMNADRVSEPYYVKYWSTAFKLSDPKFAPCMGLDELPERAEYIKNLGDIIYDQRIPLVYNSEHMLEDESQHGRLQDALRMDGKDATDKSELRYRLDSAIETMKKRVKENFRTAVPQYYRDRNAEGDGEIQLLLPLHMSDKSDSPHVVMAVSKIRLPDRIGNDPSCFQYRACTILSRDMAYSNARLICRIESEWLMQSACGADSTGNEPASATKSSPSEARDRAVSVAELELAADAARPLLEGLGPALAGWRAAGGGEGGGGSKDGEKEGATAAELPGASQSGPRAMLSTTMGDSPTPPPPPGEKGKEARRVTGDRDAQSDSAESAGGGSESGSTASWQGLGPWRPRHKTMAHPSWTINPVRPGQPVCDYFMRTGLCKYGESCKFNHPPPGSAREGIAAGGGGGGEAAASLDVDKSRTGQYGRYDANGDNRCELPVSPPPPRTHTHARHQPTILPGSLRKEFCGARGLPTRLSCCVD